MNCLVGKEIIVIGMKRSGKTTLAEWLVRHEEKTGSFILQNNTGFTLNGKSKTAHTVHFIPRLGDLFIPELKSVFVNLFVNVVEHIALDTVNALAKAYDVESQEMASYLGFGNFSMDRKTILLLSNSMNHLRSFSKNKIGRVMLGSYPRFRNQYESEFMGVTNFIADKVCVHFERFLVDSGYRRDIETKIGLDEIENDEFEWAKKALRKGDGLDVTRIHPRYQEFLENGHIPKEHLR